MAIEDLRALLNGEDPDAHLGAVGKAVKRGKPWPTTTASSSEDEKDSSE